MGNPNEMQFHTSELSAQQQESDLNDLGKQPSCQRSTTDPRCVSNIESLIKEFVGQSIDDGVQMRRLGITFRDLRVVELGIGTSTQHTLQSVIFPWSIMKHIRAWCYPTVRDIISGFEGVVFPGEMLLVLERPGSGCRAFLKTLANHRGDFHDVKGEVLYDSFTSEEIAKRYRGDVIYCPEEDNHFPTLTVRETLEFASTMRVPSRHVDNQTRKARATQTTELLMRILGIEHARNTIIGNEFLRGVSGGEKKRVSIAEVLSARGKLVCWDNVTRGLDSSTALKFIRILRTAADTAKVTNIVSMYQAGDQVFDLFDKVCLIYEGKMAYFGPAKEAKQYFTNMGYEIQDRQTTPDFLVAVTDPNARKIRPECHGVIPRTSDEMAAHFKSSDYGQLNRSSVDSYYNSYADKPALKRAYDMSATSERALRALDSHSYILSIPMQVRAVTRRRWQILKGDWITQVATIGAQIFLSALLGTVFLRMADDTSAYFSRSALLYFAIFSSSILSVAEIPSLFSQRPIVLRHENGALYYSFVESLVHTMVDIPISLISASLTGATIYFLAGLQNTAGQFFIFLLITSTMTLGIKAYFRSIAALCRSAVAAIGAVAVVLMILTLYSGLAIPVANIVGALSWIGYINPLYYAFESLMVNEFHTIDGTCTMLIPLGPGYEGITPANQVCVTPGSQPGMATVPGNAYLYESFRYSYSNLWKDFGILCALGLGAVASMLFITQYSKRAMRVTRVTLYKQGSNCVPVHHATDEEMVTPGELNEKRDFLDATGGYVADMHVSDEPGKPDIFLWKNIQYEVPVAGGKMRRLLDGVSGYAAPGKLTALIGETGAGKTTLLNVLAQRISTGMVRGECLVNGHPLPVDFSARTAYVEQMDVHISESTVREALLFSARLRQPASVPTSEKEAYVDKCLKICGLEAYADAIIGSLGVEHKKRTSIGVELAAKAKLLIFLDEPTTGLDALSAWNIVKFLRELADNGLAILCAIHQPQGELFQLFDRLLLLQKGGKTVYFGDIGPKSMAMIEYFQRNGAAPCPPNANPAEYMLDVIGASTTATLMTDWAQVWRDSPEATNLDLEIQQILEGGRSHTFGSIRRHSKYATSWMTQLKFLIRRGFVCYWRSPMYIYSKLFICVVSGLVIGFTYFGVTNSLQGCQDKLFSVFIAVSILAPLMMQHMQGKFIEHRTVYETRERPSKTFTWSAFLISELLLEIPWNILGMTLFFACWYWASGFQTSRAGYSYLLYSVVYPLYFTTFSQAVSVICPNWVVAFVLSSAMFSIVVIFAGVLQPYLQLGWWKWMYNFSPFTYIIQGLLGQALGKQLITCSSTELVTIEPLEGMSCGAYMDPYISFAGGYLTNPQATTNCAFCPFRSTDEYLMLTFNVSYGHHWRDLYIALGFTGFNILLAFAGGIYFFRIRQGMWVMLANLLERFKHYSLKTN